MGESIMNLHREYETKPDYNFESILKDMIKKKIDFKDWMSISEASKYVGVSYNTFSKFRLMGLKICEIDGIKRVSKKEINSFLEKHSF